MYVNEVNIDFITGVDRNASIGLKRRYIKKSKSSCDKYLSCFNLEITPRRSRPKRERIVSRQIERKDKGHPGNITFDSSKTGCWSNKFLLV